ncbi:hypothetical protein HDV00_011804 [Rhizophlyctis rosea]|nr:hypothetical protein HDV00_011804 [Rhizophlyctis rosea]
MKWTSAFLVAWSLVQSVSATKFGRLAALQENNGPYNSYTEPPKQTFPIAATVILQKDGAWTGDVKGVVTLKQDSPDAPTYYQINIEGLTPGKHGFHVHEFGVGPGWNCTTAGAHLNPFNQTHGAPDAPIRHLGDLGNVDASADGKVDATITDSRTHLHGPYGVVGRTIVVHADPDDLGLGDFPDSKTTGHAGKRVACGTIAYAKA